MLILFLRMNHLNNITNDLKFNNVKMELKLVVLEHLEIIWCFQWWNRLKELKIRIHSNTFGGMVSMLHACSTKHKIIGGRGRACCTNILQFSVYVTKDNWV